MHTHHKSSDEVAVIGIDIGKNTFQLTPATRPKETPEPKIPEGELVRQD